jgi:hypothetical protein
MRSLIGQDALRVGAIYPIVRLGSRHPMNQHFPVLTLIICLVPDFADYRGEGLKKDYRSGRAEYSSARIACL